MTNSLTAEQQASLHRLFREEINQLGNIERSSQWTLFGHHSNISDLSPQRAAQALRAVLDECMHNEAKTKVESPILFEFVRIFQSMTLGLLWRSELLESKNFAKERIPIYQAVTNTLLDMIQRQWV